MNRVVLYVSVATIAFIVGVTANWSINAFVGLAVDNIYRDATVDVNISIILPDVGSTLLPVPNCGRLVVTVTTDGALNLNSRQVGTLSDPSELTAKLRTVFAERERSHAYLPAPDLSLHVPDYRQIEKSVLIRAPRTVSYGEVADLIVAVKEAGADPVGLTADRLGPGLNYAPPGSLLCTEPGPCTV